MGTYVTKRSEASNLFLFFSGAIYIYMLYLFSTMSGSAIAQSGLLVVSTIGWGLVIILCLAGIVISFLSISGTWLVLAAAILAAFLPPEGFPGWWTIIIFLVISALVEVGEFFAGKWGVEKRGGSSATGWAALGGGLAGLFIGGIIPFPANLIAGPLLMIVGSFWLAYVVEYKRTSKKNQAAHVARGAVIARILVIMAKLIVTMIMIVALFAGTLMTLIRNRTSDSPPATQVEEPAPPNKAEEEVAPALTE